MAWSALWLTGCLLGAEAPAGPGDGRKLLSRHDTIATFEGIVDRPCRFRTALCPDRCDHGGKVAVFKINRYLDYEKPGEYGDPKSETFQFQVEDTQGKAKVPESLRKSVKELKKGDLVRLEWRHDYVTQEGSSFPERPVVRLDKVEAGEGSAPDPKSPAKEAAE